MKYRALALIFALTLAAGLATACGDDDDTPSAADDMAENGHADADHEEASEVAEGAREIHISATSFEFDPDHIEAEVGEDLAIVLMSDDVLHDFTIDELDAHVGAGPGETATGGFHAAEAGTYTFYCSEPGHREEGMEGTLVVS